MILRGVEALLLICALVCLGLLIRGVSGDLKDLANDRAMRERIQAGSGGAVEDSEQGSREGRSLLSQFFGNSAMAEEMYDAPNARQTVNPSVASQMAVAYESGPEVVGILEAGKDIGVYVPQGTDNEFYLNHDITGRSSKAGAAFLDYRCQLFPRSAHLMIHGHNMRSGAIFGNLDRFSDPNYLRENPVFYWTTLSGRETYVPYAISEISVSKKDAHYYKMTRFDFETDEDFKAFTGGLQERSLVELPIDVEPGDPLLSLVTCNYEYDNGRLIIALRKVRDDEDIEELVKRIYDDSRRRASD